MKKFDLNIDQMLENWDACHAIREIIANALDEWVLTGSQGISILRDSQGQWSMPKPVARDNFLICLIDE